MLDVIYLEEVTEQVIAGKPVTITIKLHSKKVEGKRTIRTEYHNDMPHNAGGWMGGTITEQVVEGSVAKVRTLIPEHRVA